MNTTLRTKETAIIKQVFLGLLLATILSKISTNICDVIDTIVIGNFYNAEYLSAIGFIRPLILIRLSLVSIISTGAVYMCGFYIGKNQKTKVNQVFSIMMLCSLVVGGLLTIVMLGFPRQLASLLGAHGEIGIYAADYLVGLGVGMIPFFLNSTLISLITLNGSKDLVFKSTISLCVSNVLLDVIFATLTPFGLFGIALATSLSYILPLCINIFHFRRSSNFFHFVPCFSAFRDLLHGMKRGLPQGVRRISVTINAILFNAIIFSIGGAGAIAVNTVVNAVIDVVTSSFVTGTSSVMSTMIALFYGEEDTDAIKETLKYTLKAQIIIPGFLMIILIIFTRPIISIFGIPSGDLASYLIALRLFSLSLILRAIVSVFATFYNATEKDTLSIVLDTIQVVVFMPFFAFIFSKVLGFNTIYASCFLASFLVLLLLAILVFIKRRHILSLTSWMMLPHNFGGKKENILTFFMREDKNSYNAAVESIENFCHRHKISDKSIMKIVLCTEELSSIFLQRNCCRKNYYLNVRILIKDEHLILRIRDNSVRFNPFDRNSNNNTLEDVEAISVKIVQSFSNECEYNYSVDMNNIFIKLKSTSLY